MNKNRVAAYLGLLLALVAGSASAVSLNPKGIGQVLVYPYYTVNKHQDTLISVANTTDIGKVVGVEFLEGINSRDVLYFKLFLSPHDVWTASVSQIADDGGAQLRTEDRSCLYFVPSNPAPFSASNYDGTGPVPADSGPQGVTRTREGYVTMIAAGDIVPGSPTDVRTRHVQNGNPGEGAPPGCAEITNTNIPEVVVVPTNGLYGSAAIVNVGEGTYFAYNADAISGFTDISLVSTASSQFSPTLQDANSVEATGGVARAYLSDNAGRPVTVDYAFGIDAISAVFMSDAIYNEYLVDASLGANTDWVVTFPTKRYYTDDIYGGVPYQPFDQAFSDGIAPVLMAGTIYDREEGSTPLGPDCDLCPPPFPPPELNYEVNVVSFLTLPAPTSGTPSGVFGSTLTSLNVTPYAGAGAVTLDLVGGSTTNHLLPGGVDPQGSAVTLRGLPVTGFMSYNIINTRAQPGMLANYGGSFHHRATTSCVGAVDECDATISGATGTR